MTLRPASEQMVTVRYQTKNGDRAGGLGLHGDIGDANFHSGANNEDALGVDRGRRRPGVG